MKDLIDFIQDDDKLREERKKAKKTRDKFVGLSSSTSANKYNDDFDSKFKSEFADLDSDRGSRLPRFGYGKKNHSKSDYRDT